MFKVFDKLDVSKVYSKNNCATTDKHTPFNLKINLDVKPTMVSSSKILLQRRAELRLGGGVGQGGSLCVPSRVLCVSCSMSHQTFTPHGRAQSVSQTCADLHYVSSRFATPFAVAVLLCAQTDLSIKRGLMDSSERRNDRLRRAAESRSTFFFDIRVCKECKWMNGWLILASDVVDSRKCVLHWLCLHGNLHGAWVIEQEFGP